MTFLAAWCTLTVKYHQYFSFSLLGLLCNVFITEAIYAIIRMLGAALPHTLIIIFFFCKSASL